MKARTTIILAVIAAVLIMIAVFSNRTERAHERLQSGPIFPELQREAVTGILMTAESDTVRLTKEAGLWLVETEGGYPADTLAVKRILDKFESFDIKHLRSRNPEKQAAFEVDDSSGTEILIAQAGGQKLAHFRMGKNGPDYRSQYLRPIDSNNVYLIPAYLKSAFDVKRSTWREKNIFAFEQGKVKQLLIEPEGKESIAILKDDAGNYVMTAPDSAGVQKNLVESTIRTLARLRCDAFPDSLPSVVDAGLDPPQQRIEVRLEDGAIFALNIGKMEDDVRYYAMKEGDNMLFLLTKGRVSTLIKDAEQLKEEPPEPSETQDTSVDPGPGG
ncbi:MAG: DUF4340 domain-containing protein [Candidatus Eisenbacteria sp.]|nr:DUF4340 domain-containing protein [Candidatus Eisenbacteria bacterium]